MDLSIFLNFYFQIKKLIHIFKAPIFFLIIATAWSDLKLFWLEYSNI